MAAVLGAYGAAEEARAGAVAVDDPAATRAGLRGATQAGRETSRILTFRAQPHP
jgi:hypothetical protein